MRKPNKKLLSILLALLLGCGCISLAESAKTPVGIKDIDLEETGSITVTLTDNTAEHNPIAGGRLTLYNIGEAYIENNNLCFALAPAFEGSGADLSKLNAEGLPQSLLEYAEANTIAGRTEKANENGVTVFDKLTIGLYLIAQHEGDAAEGFYPVSPFLVPIPMMNNEGTGWIYDITAEPKAPTEPVPPPWVTQLKVIKVWEDDNDPERPLSAAVQLYCGEEPYGEPVVLNAKNDWTYTWTELEDGHSWTVKEIPVPTNYKAAYDYTTQLVTVTNTKKLVQTGQLKWPVPALACIGALTLMLGLALKTSVRRSQAK